MAQRVALECYQQALRTYDRQSALNATKRLFLLFHLGVHNICSLKIRHKTKLKIELYWLNYFKNSRSGCEGLQEPIYEGFGWIIFIL